MTIFMNGSDLVGTVERIRAEMRTKRSLGKPGKADEDYMGCISMLEACLSTGEMSLDQRERIESAIGDFKRHVDLGIIVNGRFSPIQPSQAARWDIAPGSVINMFPVVTKDEAARLLRHPELLDFNRCRWDHKTTSLITLSAYYRRYPGHILELSDKQAAELGLLDERYNATIVAQSNLKRLSKIETFDF